MALTLLPAQGAKKAFHPADVALQPLFSWVSPELLRQRRTYALFFALLDNYHRCAQPDFACQCSNVQTPIDHHVP